MESEEETSIDGIAKQLAYWGKIPNNGMALVEFDSPLAQEEVLKRLREEYSQANVPFYELHLESNRSALEHIQRLRYELPQLPRGVVSITGFGSAFDKTVSIADHLRAIEFNRDTLVNFDVRQIWWVSRDLAQEMDIKTRSLARWFLTRFLLSEIPTTHHSTISSQHTFISRITEGDYLPPEEAIQVSKYQVSRFNTALAKKESIQILISLIGYAFDPLIKSGDVSGANALVQNLFQALEKAGYDPEHYSFEAELKSAQDAENISRLGWLALNLKDYEKGVRLYRRALTIKTQLFGEDHPQTALTRANIAELYLHLGKFDLSEEYYKQSIPVLELAFGEEHENTRIPKQNYERLLQLKKLG